MKPRYRPGKAAAASKTARKALSEAKPAVAIQFKKTPRKTARKAGTGGERKSIDFLEAPRRRMKNAEYDAFSHDSIRRLPKRGGTHLA